MKPTESTNNLYSCWLTQEQHIKEQGGDGAMRCSHSVGLEDIKPKNRLCCIVENDKESTGGWRKKGGAQTLNGNQNNVKVE